MSGTYGPMSGRQFATYDPATSSWKMWPDTGLWGSIEYSETWPKTGYMHGGQAYELPTLVPRTIVSGFSSSRLFPTPKASDGIMGRPRTSGRPIEKSTHLGTIVTLLPTPRAADHQATMGSAGARRHVEKGNGSLAKTVGVKMLPTPTASDARRADSATDRARNTPPLTVVTEYFPDLIGERVWASDPAMGIGDEAGASPGGDES